MVGKARKWCLTIDKNVEGLTFDDISSMYNPTLMRYFIYGFEKGKKTGNLHYQCYVQMKKQYRLKKLKSLFCNYVHCEIQHKKSKNEHARNYCWKGNHEEDGTPTPQPSFRGFEFGKFCEGQGDRTEMKDIKEDIDVGLEHYEIVQNADKFNTYSRYHSWFYKYKQMVDDEKFNVIRESIVTNVILGEPGTGKTTSIYNKEGFKNCYRLKNPNGDNKNWNGYNGQKILIIDDFYGWIPLNDMLNILDNKPYRVRMLMNYSWAKWTKVYITSNVSIEHWYKNIDKKSKVLKAFYSRIKKCLKVDRGNTGSLSISEIALPARGRNNHKQYLNITDLFD